MAYKEVSYGSDCSHINKINRIGGIVKPISRKNDTIQVKKDCITCKGAPEKRCKSICNKTK